MRSPEDFVNIYEKLVAVHRRRLKIALCTLTVVLLALFITLLLYAEFQTAWLDTVLLVVIGVMTAGYSLIFLALFPLFFLFVRLLKSQIPEMYERVKVRLYISFITFMLVLAFRLTAYIIIQFSSLPWLTVETVRGEIPLYISEIFIALCYVKILHTKYRKQVKSKQEAEGAMMEADDDDPMMLPGS